MALFGNKKGRKAEEGAPQELLVPTHIAIIPDGNRRWAREHHLPVPTGHFQGAKALMRIARHAQDLGVKYITFYTFSTENWNRSEEEISAIMRIVLSFFRNSDEEMGADKFRTRVLVKGEMSALSEDLRKEIDRVVKETAGNKGTTTILALNYGGRDELTHAVRSIAREVEEGKISSSDITQDTISEHLYTADIPDPDLLIRTSGEMRISNFLLWQLAYTEFVFSDKYWPAFENEDLDKAIEAFNHRKRRFGAG